MYQFKLPDIGEGVTEGEIVKWHVSEGDSLKRDQDMVEIMTDKVTVRIPSPVDGKVSRILFKEGQVAAVGSTLIEIDAGENGPEQQSTETPGESTDNHMEAAAAHGDDRTAVPERVLASPAVRRMAREKGVDLSRITGSAENGRITIDDLENYLKRPETPVHTDKIVTEPAFSGKTSGETVLQKSQERVPGDEILEPRGLRRVIFDRMTKSKQVMPHFSVVEEVDVTRLMEMVKTLSGMDTRVTLTSFFIKASAVILREFPYLNAVYNETSRNYTLRGEYNIGMAVDTPNGLTVPVIHSADRKSILAIGEDVRNLASKARDSTLDLKDVQGGTFTVTNIGPIGGLLSTPIINYPEVAILGVHRSFRSVSDGTERMKVYLSLSCDHRLIDGAMATRFLMKLKAAIENPEYFLVR